jgi:hypothetical protein
MRLASPLLVSALLAGCFPDGGYVLPAELAPAALALQRDVAAWPLFLPIGGPLDLPYAGLQRPEWEAATWAIGLLSSGVGMTMLQLGGGQGGGGVARPAAVDETAITWEGFSYRLVLQRSGPPHDWRLQQLPDLRLVASGTTGQGFTADLTLVHSSGAQRAIYTRGAAPLRHDLRFTRRGVEHHLREERGVGGGTIVTTTLTRDVHGDGGAAEEIELVVRTTPLLAGRADARITGGDLGAHAVVATECWDASHGVQVVVYQGDTGGLGPTLGSVAGCWIPSPAFGASPRAPAHGR